MKQGAEILHHNLNEALEFHVTILTMILTQLTQTLTCHFTFNFERYSLRVHRVIVEVSKFIHKVVIKRLRKVD
jgi:hypothetical protein